MRRIKYAVLNGIFKEGGGQGLKKKKGFTEDVRKPYFLETALCLRALRLEPVGVFSGT
jgi:hypothetical protein